MVRFSTIQKNVRIPHSLKTYFGAGSHEYESLDFEKKLGTLREVVNAGYSVYDLTKEFIKLKGDYYNQDSVKRVLSNYIAKIIYDDFIVPIVDRYYRDDEYEVLAKDLDKFLLKPIDSVEFEKLVIAKVRAS